MLTLAGTARASITGNISPNLKNPGIPYVNPPTRVTGDTVADPFFIYEPLPVTITGTTTGFTHDYDEVCPYSGGTAPDVVYSFTPTNATLLSINIDLCYSSYDTKVYVYDNAWTPGAPLACNDDYYFSLPCYTYSSFLGFVPVSAGHTYYIVVDGYGGASGTYQVDVTDAGPVPPIGACCQAIGFCAETTQADCTGVWQGEGTSCVPNPCMPPDLLCPTGALVEGEPPCVDGNPDDNYNGGCNSTPNVFQVLYPQAGGCATMCGTSCATSSTRDTDWFVSIGSGALMTGTCVAEFPLQYLLIYGTDCAAPSYLYGLGDPGVPVTLSWTVAAGAEVWNWIGSSDFSYWPESLYVLDLCGITWPLPPGACCRDNVCIMTSLGVCDFLGGVFYGPGTPCDPSPCVPVPTVSMSWGEIKAMYRIGHTAIEAGPGR
jgi:hypothetical protein